MVTYDSRWLGRHGGPELLYKETCPIVKFLNQLHTPPWTITKPPTTENVIRPFDLYSYYTKCPGSSGRRSQQIRNFDLCAPSRYNWYGAHIEGNVLFFLFIFQRVHHPTRVWDSRWTKKQANANNYWTFTCTMGCWTRYLFRTVARRHSEDEEPDENTYNDREASDPSISEITMSKNVGLENPTILFNVVRWDPHCPSNLSYANSN